MKRRFLFVLAVIVLAGLFPGPGARAFLGDSDKAFGLSGSVRGIFLYADPYDFPAFFGWSGDDDTRASATARLVAAGRPTERLSYELHLVTAYDYFSTAGGGFFAQGAVKPHYRIGDETRDIGGNDHNQSSLWLDRANVKAAFGSFDLTAGRQAVTFGKAWFWNPLDVFYPFDSRQFDRDYKPGVDALRLEVPFSRFSGATLVAALGRRTLADGSYETKPATDADWYGSALIGRLYATLSGFDMVLMGGKVYGGGLLGGGATGELGPLAVRFEAAYFFVDGDSASLPWPLSGSLYADRVTGVLGMGRRFENSLDIELEYLYDSGGASSEGDWNAALARYQAQALLQLSNHMLGFTVSYDVSPLATGRVAVMQSLSRGISTNISPSLTVSLSDNAEAVFGASLNFGPRPVLVMGLPVIQSEFGTFPSQFYVEIKQYF